MDDRRSISQPGAAATKIGSLLSHDVANSTPDAARTGDVNPTIRRAGASARPSCAIPFTERHPVRSRGARSQRGGAGPQSGEGSPRSVRRRDRSGDVSRAWTVTSRDRTGVSCPPPPSAPQSDTRRLCGSSEGRPAASRGGGAWPCHRPEAVAAAPVPPSAAAADTIEPRPLRVRARERGEEWTACSASRSEHRPVNSLRVFPARRHPTPTGTCVGAPSPYVVETAAAGGGHGRLRGPSETQIRIPTRPWPAGRRREGGRRVAGGGRTAAVTARCPQHRRGGWPRPRDRPRQPWQRPSRVATDAVAAAEGGRAKGRWRLPAVACSGPKEQRMMTGNT